MGFDLHGDVDVVFEQFIGPQKKQSRYYDCLRDQQLLRQRILRQQHSRVQYLVPSSLRTLDGLRFLEIRLEFRVDEITQHFLAWDRVDEWFRVASVHQGPSYGLVQSHMVWFTELHTTMTSAGLLRGLFCVWLIRGCAT